MDTKYTRINEITGKRENVLSEDTQQLIADTRANMANLWETMNTTEAYYDELRQENSSLKKENEELKDEVARLKRILKSRESDIPWINRTDATVDEWEQKTLDFIRENKEQIGNRLCSPIVPNGTIDECLKRIQKYGWTVSPEFALTDRRWLHLIKDESE